MPKPWDYDWSGAGDPSGLNLLPIMPFFGGQRPPMLGEGGQSIDPSAVAMAAPYPVPGIDTASAFPAATADPSAMPATPPSPMLAADASAVPGMAPPQPLAAGAVGQQPPLASTGVGAERVARPPQPLPSAPAPIPEMPPPAAGPEAQRFLQPAAYDNWSRAGMQDGGLGGASQTDSDPAGLIPAQRRATLSDGVPDMMPLNTLAHGSTAGTSARQPPLHSAKPRPVLSGDMRDARSLQKEQLQVAADLFLPLPGMPQGMVNMAAWFDRLERVGERWRREQVSPKGARGPMQVTLIGAKEAAKILGIKLDLNRWKNDPDYGRMLGQADAASLLQRYGGDVVLATAAYNYGYPRLDRLLKRIGDPRRGEISHEEFALRFPAGETRKYIKRVVYDNMTEEQSEPKQTQPRRRAPPLLRSQEPERRQSGR